MGHYLLPNQGNLIPHESLFGKPAKAADAPAPRVWRHSLDGSMGFVQEVGRGKIAGLMQPFTITSERGIKDFVGLYSIYEPSTDILIFHAETIVETQRPDRRQGAGEERRGPRVRHAP